MERVKAPAKLRRVIVDLIDAEDWSAMGADVKGDAYEGLLERNAQDIKSGAGQYFMPRARIQAMVDCIAPRPVHGADELLARENEVPAEANLGVAEVKAHSAGRSHKASLDIFWLKDESLADSDNLPPPEVIAQEIVDDLEPPLAQFRLIAADVGEGGQDG